VGFVDQLDPFRVGIACPVGVVLLGKLPIGALNDLCLGPFVDLKHPVVVFPGNLPLFSHLRNAPVGKTRCPSAVTVISDTLIDRDGTDQPVLPSLVRRDRIQS
jgi:hypothetical protein